MINSSAHTTYTAGRLTFIVRDFDNSGKYLINSRDLVAALKTLDTARAAGRSVDLVAKNLANHKIVRNQIKAVDDAHVDAARALTACECGEAGLYTDRYCSECGRER